MRRNYRKWCTDCCRECASPALYRLSAPALDGFSVGAFEDDTCVWLGDASGPQEVLAHLGAQEIATGNIGAGQVLWTNDKPISASGEEGAADVALLPTYLSGDVLGTTMSRHGGIHITLWSLTATSAQIFRNGTLETTLPLVPDQVANFTKTNNYTGNWKVVANGQVIGFKQEDNYGNGDSGAFFVPATDIVGWPSTAAYIASEDQINASFTLRTSGFNDYSGTTGATYNIVNSADLASTTPAHRYYDPTTASRVEMTSIGDRIYANSRADGDGGNDTGFMPTNLMRTHHLIPQSTEFISFLTLATGSVQEFAPNGTLVATHATTKTNPHPLAPFAARIGTPNGAVNKPAGTLLVSDQPTMVVYQTKGAGAAGSDDDETVSFGYDL